MGGVQGISAFGDQETLLTPGGGSLLEGFLDLPKTFDYCPGARRFRPEIVLTQDDFGIISAPALAAACSVNL